MPVSVLLQSAGGENTAQLHGLAFSDGGSGGLARALTSEPGMRSYLLQNPQTRKAESSQLWRLVRSDQTQGRSPDSPSSGLATLGLPSGSPASANPSSVAPNKSGKWTSWILAGSVSAALAALVAGGAYFRGRRAGS
jgi:hypothetical protein